MALAATAVASQPGPFEPNDSEATATGPLYGGFTYKAAIEHHADASAGLADDVDWYVFYTSGNVDFEVAYRNLQTAGNCFGPQATLFDNAGNSLGSAHPPAQETQRISHSALTANRFFLRVEPYSIVRCDPPDTVYSFEITPPNALRIPPAQPPVKPLKRPYIRVKEAFFRSFVHFEGSRAAGTSASRIRLTVWKGKGTKRVYFKLRGHSTGKRRWSSAKRLPQALRPYRSLRYRVRYLGDGNFSPQVSKVRTFRRRR